MPGACQSRAVTEPQREKTRLKLDKPPQKGLIHQGFRAKRHFEHFQNARRISGGHDSAQSVCDWARARFLYSALPVTSFIILISGGISAYSEPCPYMKSIARSRLNG